MLHSSLKILNNRKSELCRNLQTVFQGSRSTCGELVLSSLQLYSRLFQSLVQYKYNFYQKHSLLVICSAELASYWMHCYVACIVADWQSHLGFSPAVTCQLHNEKKAAIHKVLRWWNTSFLNSFKMLKFGFWWIHLINLPALHS